MDLEGSLGVFEPISVLQLIHISQSSGELVLDSGHNSARIYFQRGDVLYAEINQRSLKLGEYLVRQGIISQRNLDKVLVMNRKGRRLGDMLIEHGVLDGDKLRVALEEQVKEVIYEVVRWKKGWFRFASGRKPPTEEVTIHIPLDHLMLEGLKRMDEEDGGSG